MSQAAAVVMLRWLFALIGVVLLLVFVVRPVWRMLRQQPEPDLLTPDFSHLLEEQEQELEIPADAEAPEFDRAAALKAVRKDPHATAMLLRSWLKQKK